MIDSLSSVQRYATYWHCRHSMRSRVYETVRCPPVCSSVCPSMVAQQQSLYCRFAAVSPADRNWGDIDRLLEQRRANAGTATFSAYVVVEHRLVFSLISSSSYSLLKCSTMYLFNFTLQYIRSICYNMATMRCRMTPIHIVLQHSTRCIHRVTMT